jgi:hypothetical protein
VCLFEASGLPFVVKRIGETMLEDKEDLLARKNMAGEQEINENEITDGEVKTREKVLLYELVGAAYVYGIMDGEGIDVVSEAATILLKQRLLVKID